MWKAHFSFASHITARWGINIARHPDRGSEEIDRKRATPVSASDKSLAFGQDPPESCFVEQNRQGWGGGGRGVIGVMGSLYVDQQQDIIMILQ